MEKSTLKSGAFAALFEALVYIFGFAVMVFYLNPSEGSEVENGTLLHFLENKNLFQVWMVFIYVFFGIALVFLNSALKTIYKNFSEHYSEIMATFGNIWAVLVIASGMIAVIGIDVVDQIAKTNIDEAAILWTTLNTIQNGLGGGVEIIGGIWVLLISVIGLKYKTLSKYLHWLGILVAIAGILTIVPILKELGSVFGILQIFWFTALGIGLWRKSRMLK